MWNSRTLKTHGLIQRACLAASLYDACSARVYERIKRQAMNSDGWMSGRMDRGTEAEREGGWRD